MWRFTWSSSSLAYELCGRRLRRWPVFSGQSLITNMPPSRITLSLKNDGGFNVPLVTTVTPSQVCFSFLSRFGPSSSVSNFSILFQFTLFRLNLQVNAELCRWTMRVIVKKRTRRWLMICRFASMTILTIILSFHDSFCKTYEELRLEKEGF